MSTGCARASCPILAALVWAATGGVPAAAQEPAPPAAESTEAPAAPDDAGDGEGAPPAAGAPAPDDAEGLSPVQRFRRGEMHFAYGDCAGTVSALAPVAVPGELEDEKQLVEAHRMLAVCYFQQGRPDEVKRQLESLLFIDPEYELDPFRTPPPVMELFDELKDTIREKLRAIEDARKQREAKTQKPTGTLLVERTTVVRETPFAAVFLPFGLSQWANGEVIKAAIVGSLQGLTLATNIGAGVTALGIDAIDGTIGSYPRDEPVQAVAYQGAWLVSTLALATFVGVYGYGVADAMWNYEETTTARTKEDRRELTPQEAQQELRRLDE